MSFLSSSVGDFFGLDIGTTAIRLVHVGPGTGVRPLLRYAYVPVDAKLSLSEAPADQQKIADIIKSLVAKSGVTTKNVAVGLPSQKVFTTVVDIDRLNNEELSKSIKYQADSIIPTPLAESKIDWQVIGDSPVDKTKVEVLLSSVSNDYVEKKLDMLESIGLNVIAFEPDTLALMRALVSADTLAPVLILDVGNLYTDLIIVVDGSPRLTRSIPTGYEAIIRAAAQNLNIDETQARQFVAKFGMSADKLEGQISRSISGIIDTLMVEIEKSIKFFRSRYATLALERIIVTGGASVLPEFPLFVANKLGVNVEIAYAWRNVAVNKERQNELLILSNQFGVAVGLAERKA